MYLKYMQDNFKRNMLIQVGIIIPLLFVFFNDLWYDIWQVFGGGVYMHNKFSDEEIGNYLVTLIEIVHDKYNYLGISRGTISKIFEKEVK